MLSTAVHKQAQLLACEHHRHDPSLVAVFVVPDSKDVRLLEVSRSVATTREVIPFRYPGRPDSELPLDTVMVLVSEDEYRLIQDGALDLPEGWGSVDELVQIDFEDAGG